jgi:RNA polymerase sigma-70 factor (ECF subfamily)
MVSVSKLIFDDMIKVKHRLDQQLAATRYMPELSKSVAELVKPTQDVQNHIAQVMSPFRAVNHLASTVSAFQSLTTNSFTSFSNQLAANSFTSFSQEIKSIRFIPSRSLFTPVLDFKVHLLEEVRQAQLAAQSIHQLVQDTLKSIQYTRGLTNLMNGVRERQNELRLQYEAVLVEEAPSYREALYTCAYKIVQNVEDAWDIVQHAYVKAFRHLRTATFARILELLDGLVAWLYTIVKNTAYDLLEERRRYRRPPANRIARLPGYRFDQPETVVLRQEKSHVLQDAVRKLPQHEQEVLLLHYWEPKMTAKEIARHLGSSQNTVLSRLKRGRERLHQQLIGQGYEPCEAEVESGIWPYLVDSTTRPLLTGRGEEEDL